MIIYDVLFILQFQVSTTVMDLVAVFALLVFMPALQCFCVATVFFSVNKDLYLYNSESLLQQATAGAFGKLSNSLLWSLMINIFDKTVSRPLTRGSCRRPPPLSYATAARHGPVRTGPGPSRVWVRPRVGGAVLRRRDPIHQRHAAERGRLSRRRRRRRCLPRTLSTPAGPTGAPARVRPR